MQKMRLKSIWYCAFIIASSVMLSSKAFANDNYEKALSSYNQGELEEAYIHIRNALNNSQDHLPSKVLMGEILLRQGLSYEGIEEFEEAIVRGADINLVARSLLQSYVLTRNLDKIFSFDGSQLTPPNLIELLLAQANGYYAQRDFDKAENAYQRLLNMSQQRLRILSSYINFLIKTNQLDQAHEYTQIVRKEFGEHSLFYYAKGLELAARKNVIDAINNFERAHELSPQDPQIKRALASVLMQAKHYERAGDIADKILEQTPDDPYALLFKGRIINISSGRDAAADVFEALNQKLSVLPSSMLEDNASLLLINGINHYLSGNFESALSSLESYIQRVKTNEYAVGLLTQIYLALGQEGQAFNALKDNYKLVSKSIGLGSLLCEFYLSTKQYFKCQELLDSLEQQYPEHPNLKVLRVKYLQERQRYLEALALFHTLFNDDSLKTKQNVDLQLLYISLLRQTNNAQKALSFVDSLLYNDPDNLGFQAIKSNLLMSMRQLDKAEKINKVILANNPDSYTANIASAQLSIEKGQLDMAETRLRTLITNEPSTYLPRILLAEVLIKQDNVDEAEDILLDLSVQFNDIATPTEMLTSIYLNRNDLDKALSYANKLTRDFFLNPDYLQLKASIHYKRGEQTEANRQLNIISGLWQDNALNMISLAGMQVAINNIDGAIASLQRSLKLDNNIFVKRRLLDLYIKGRYQSEAKALLNELANDETDDATMMSANGDYALYIENDIERARYLYLQAHTKAPRDPIFAAKLYQIVVASPDAQYEPFERAFKKVISTYPALSLHKNLLADYLLILSDYEQAEPIYLDLLNTQSPNTSDIANNLANIYLTQGRNEEAKRYAQQAFSLAGSQAHIMNTYGEVLLVNGSLEQALGILRKAYSKNSTSPYIRLNLITVLEKLGNVAEAKRLFTALDISGLNAVKQKQAVALKTRLETL